MTRQFQQFIEKIDVSRKLEQPRSLLLNQPDRIWLVEQGTVDLFSAEIGEGEVSGYRSHLFRAEQGELIFGLDTSGSETEICLLAVGREESVLLEIRHPAMEELLKDPDGFQYIENSLERWIARLTAEIGKKRVPPADLQILPVNTETRLEPETDVGIENRLLWISPVIGNLLFMGQERNRLSDRQTIPLVGNAWLHVAGESLLQTLDTKSLVQQNQLDEALASFHRIILREFAQIRAEKEQQNRRRLEERKQNDRLSLATSLTGIATILEKDRAVKNRVENRDQALLEAIRQIGAHMDCEIVTPVIEKNATLNDIARASRLRTRTVCLKGEWWRKDNGPLLAYLEDSHQPVAILPTSAASYLVWDPLSGREEKLDAKLAETLEPMAICFYTPFPEKALNVKDLLRFSLNSSGRDRYIIIAVGILAGLLGLLTPILSGQLFDSVIPNAAKGQLLQIVAIITATAVTTALFDITKGIAVLRISGKISNRVQSAVWDRLLALPVTFFRNYTAGDLTQRSMCIQHIQQILDNAAINVALGCIFSLFNLALLFYYDVSLALVAMGITAIGILFSVGVNYFQFRFQKAIQDIEGRNMGLIFQLLTGISKLRISGSEDRAFSLWAGSFTEKKRISFKAGTVQNIHACFFSFYTLLCSMLIYSWIIFQDVEGLSIGNFVSFISALGAFQVQMITLVNTFTESLAVIPLFNRAKPIFEAMPESDSTREHPGELTGDIGIHNVNFRYKTDTPLVLTDVTMHIYPGEFLAIVGESGSGKSTLLRILLGFESPESGSIYFDGQDIADIDIREVRRQTGVVLQNGSLMPGSVFENIVGISNRTIDDAWEAARMVGLDQDIDAMPMKMQTLVSAGGGTFSGGQRQRMLIARAVVNKPRILYFDEATSALDNKTQAIVSQSLEKLKSTRIVVAHRLSTIINADRIVVMDKGRIVESGTYHELMENHGIFANLARRQIA